MLSQKQDQSVVCGVSRVATCCVLLSVVALAACSGATRRASSPQKSGKTTTTGASLDGSPRVERLVVAEHGTMSMVGRDGCIATVVSSEIETGTSDELRIRCPKKERMKTWFDAVDRILGGFAYEPVNMTLDEDKQEDDKQEVTTLPAGKVLTDSGKLLRIAKKADVDRLAHEIHSLSAELAAAEEPAPGPASAAGWQMLHVTGPAHVLFAGTPARGVLEARVSTNGQYLCEFIMNAGDGPIRATKSGWIAPTAASHAIDQVLAPYTALGASERSRSTFAAGMTNGAERRASEASTAAVFERFAEMQDALGDACLPELEPPAASPVGL